MKSSSKIVVFILTLLISTFLFAQNDSVSVDTTKKVRKSLSSRYNELSRPEKASLLSATIPGLGQAYNKKYWKIPIIYGIGGFMIASAIYHHKEYRTIRDGLLKNTWTDTSGAQLYYDLPLRGQVYYFQEPYTINSENQYRTARDQQRGKRDLFIVYSIVFYSLNVIDAIVDAHLHEFDLGDDLSLEINPNIYNTNNKFAAGVTLNFNLK